MQHCFCDASVEITCSHQHSVTLSSHRCLAGPVMRASATAAACSKRSPPELDPLAAVSICAHGATQYRARRTSTEQRKAQGSVTLDSPVLCVSVSASMASSQHIRFSRTEILPRFAPRSIPAAGIRAAQHSRCFLQVDLQPDLVPGHGMTTYHRPAAQRSAQDRD